MSQKKFILFSILKTWFTASLISLGALIGYLAVTRLPVQDGHPRNCDMSGLAYGILIFWILSLSIISFSSLFCLLKTFRGNTKRTLCWFLLPVLFAAYFFVGISDGNIDRESVVFFLMANLPWFVTWGLYYYRFNSLYKQ